MIKHLLNCLMGMLSFARPTFYETQVSL